MQLKDLTGLFFKEKPATPTLEELGDTGTTMYNGMISGEEYNYDLSGTAKYTIYDKMRKGDATIAATLRVLKLPLRSANWYVEPAGKDKLQQEQAEFIEHNLKEGMSITWDDFIRQALLMLDYGVFVFEKVYDNVVYKNKTYIGWRKFAPRHPRTIQAWKINDGNDDGIKQLVNNRDTVEIPMEKLLIFVNEKEGDNWEGISILRSAYKNWFFKDIFEQIDAMAFERQGLGVPYCKIPAGANNAKDKANATAIVKNLRANEKAYVVYPEGYEVGFLDMGAGKTRDPKNSIEYHNRQIALNVLAQFLMLGAGDKGSFALSKDQSSFFYDSLQAVAKNILDVINKYAIKQLVELNWPGTSEYPTLKVDDIGAIDKVQFATMINTLVGANIIKTDDDLDRYIRKELDMPESQEGDEDDSKTDELENQLDLLSIEVAGEGEPNPELKQAAMAEDQEDALQMNEEIQDYKLMFVAKGGHLDDATKKKISEALKKKYGTTAKPEDIESASTAQTAIIDAKRRIDELKTVIDRYRQKSKSIENKKVKKEFNKAIASKIDEIKAMIKSGREGIKAEQARAKKGESNIKQDIKERKTALRKTRLQKRIDRDNLRIEKLNSQLDKTDSPSKQKDIRQRIQDVRDLLKERKDTLAELNASEPEQKKNLKQLSEEFKSYRKLTAAEKKVNFGNIQKELDKQEKAFENLLKGSLTDEKTALLKQFETAIKAGDYKTIQDIELKYSGKYKDDVFNKMKELYAFGKNGVAAEMKVTPPANPKSEMDRLSAQASVMVDDHEIKVLTKTKMSALDSMAKKSTAAEAIARVGKTMDQAIKELSQNTASIIAGGSFNQGRRLTQFSNKGKIYGFQRSELLDDRTCMFCMSIDGRVVDPEDPIAGEDIFHSNCRGMWVEILKDEAELPAITGIPKSLLKDYEGVNDFKQLKNPQVTKASLAAEAIQEEYKKQISEREKKLANYEKEGKYPDRQTGHKKEIARMKNVIDKLK